MDKYNQNEEANSQNNSTPITVKQIDESIFGILFLLILIPKIYLNWENISGLPLPRLLVEFAGLFWESIWVWLVTAGLYYLIVRIKNQKNSEKTKNTRIIFWIIFSLLLILWNLGDKKINNWSHDELNKEYIDKWTIKQVSTKSQSTTISEKKSVNTQNMIVDLFWTKFKEKMTQAYILVDRYMAVWTRNEKDKILWEMGNMLNKEITDLDVVLLYTLSEVYKKNEYWVDWKKDFGDEELIKLLKAFWSMAYSKLQTEENIVNRYNFMLIRAWVFGSLYMNHNEVSLDDVKNIYKEYFNSISQNELKIDLEKFQLSWKKIFNIHHEVDNINSWSWIANPRKVVTLLGILLEDRGKNEAMRNKIYTKQCVSFYKMYEEMGRKSTMEDGTVLTMLDWANTPNDLELIKPETFIPRYDPLIEKSAGSCVDSWLNNWLFNLDNKIDKGIIDWLRNFNLDKK